MIHGALPGAVLPEPGLPEDAPAADAAVPALGGLEHVVLVADVVHLVRLGALDALQRQIELRFRTLPPACQGALKCSAVRYLTHGTFVTL